LGNPREIIPIADKIVETLGSLSVKATWRYQRTADNDELIVEALVFGACEGVMETIDDSRRLIDDLGAITTVNLTRGFYFLEGLRSGMEAISVSDEHEARRIWLQSHPDDKLISVRRSFN
jgi:hypothetical protein